MKILDEATCLTVIIPSGLCRRNIFFLKGPRTVVSLSALVISGRTAAIDDSEAACARLCSDETCCLAVYPLRLATALENYGHT
jgi:hypothetical protein